VPTLVQRRCWVQGIQHRRRSATQGGPHDALSRLKGELRAGVGDAGITPNTDRFASKSILYSPKYSPGPCPSPKTSRNEQKRVKPVFGDENGLRINLRKAERFWAIGPGPCLLRSRRLHAGREGQGALPACSRALYVGIHHPGICPVHHPGYTPSTERVARCCVCTVRTCRAQRPWAQF